MRGGLKNTSWTKETAPAGPGRPKGARDVVPRSVKASIRKIFEELGANATNRELITAAIMRGIQAEPPKSFPYLQMLAAYIDGRPAEKVSVEMSMKQINVIQRFDDGTETVRAIVVGRRDEVEAAEDAYIGGEVEDDAPRALPPGAAPDDTTAP